MNKASDWRNPSDGEWPASERRERLEYMADMLRELEELAVRDGCLNLPNALAVARAEAFREALKEQT